MNHLMPDGKEVGARRRRADGIGPSLALMHSTEHPHCKEVARRSPIPHAIYAGWIRPARWRMFFESRGL